MDESRHHGGGDEVNKEDETVMDSEQGSSTWMAGMRGGERGLLG